MQVLVQPPGYETFVGRRETLLTKVPGRPKPDEEWTVQKGGLTSKALSGRNWSVQEVEQAINGVLHRAYHRTWAGGNQDRPVCGKKACVFP